MNELVMTDVLTTAIPVVILLLGIYIFFKVASFIVKTMLALVCLAMLAYLIMSFMGVDFVVLEEQVHDATGWY